MKCIQCNHQFIPSSKKQKFCNSSCAATHNNIVRGQKQYELSSRTCVGCNVKLRNYQKKYCSKECSSSSRLTKTNNQVVDGKKVSVGTLRKYLYKTRPIQCELCKGTEWFGRPMPLVMDHIDGNPSNDILDNLRLICPNCDRFLPTFGSRNKGKGRKSLGIKRGSNL